MQLKNYKQTSWLQPLLYENGLRNCMDWAEVGAPVVVPRGARLLASAGF